MMILSQPKNYQSLRQLQTGLLVREIAIQLASDLRWGLLALALNLLTAAWVFARLKFASPGRGCTSARREPADSMVAAGLR